MGTGTRAALTVQTRSLRPWAEIGHETRRGTVSHCDGPLTGDALVGPSNIACRLRCEAGMMWGTARERSAWSGWNWLSCNSKRRRG